MSILETGNEVELLTFPDGRDIEHPGLKIIRFPRKPLFSTLENGQYLKILLYSMLLFLKLLFSRKRKYDVIYTSGTLTPFLWIISYLTRKPFVAFIISTLEDELLKWNISNNRTIYRIFKSIDTFANKQYYKLIFQRKELLDEYLKRGLKPQKAFLIKQSIAIPEESVTNLHHTSEGFSLLYTGTFVKVQNIDLILSAALYLINEDLKIILIGGSEKDREKLETRIHSMKIQNIVKVVPRVSPQELKRYIDNADVLLSARTFGYDTPIKIFYYLSYGKCILATDCPIHTGVLNNDISVLFEPNAKKFADKIIELKNSPELIIEKALKSKLFFKAEFSPEIQIRKYEEFFDIIKNEMH